MERSDLERQEEVQLRQDKLAQELGEKALAVGIFCSARDLSDRLTQPAKEFAQMIGEEGYDLVWGGSDIGTMHVISAEARAAGAKIIGVTTESLSRSQHKTADEMIVTGDLSERKMKIVERSDVLVVLPGGTGTLDEVADVIERKKFGEHYKSVIFLNADNFYDGLKVQFDRMEKEGMLNRALSEIVSFAENADEVMELIREQQQQHFSAIFDKHDIVEYASITAGHSGALLFRARNSDSERIVVKVSNDKISTKEIKSNIRAYKKILDSGLSSLIPEITAHEDPIGRKYILMPDLGESFASQAKSEIGADYPTLIRCLLHAFYEQLRENEAHHTDSIETACNALQQYQSSLRTGGIPTESTLENIASIAPNELGSSMSSFFLLDFTPDNIFIQNEKVQFIDPWEQTTYQGSSIISLSQFQTLAKDVYQLPGSKDAEPLFDELYEEMRVKLGLTHAQLHKQQNLGAALQYSLSSFTRLNKNQEEAHKFYKLSDEAVRKIIDK